MSRRKRAPWGALAAELRAAEFIACTESRGRCLCAFNCRSDAVEQMAQRIKNAYWEVG